VPTVGFLSSLKKLFAARDKTPRVDVKKRFDLLGRTGQGSMSKVFRAYDRKLGRNVCLKVLDREKTARFEARFAPGLKRPSEGVICMSLRHDNVVRTYEAGLTTDREPFLVMELIEGVGLNFLIETSQRRLEKHITEYLIQLTNAIEYVHKQGFLHRDICPRNTMVTNDEVVRVIDFGLAVPDTPDFRKPGIRTGTANYLAPEIIKRLPTDRRVDLFALGVTAYEMFSGGLPWEKGQSLQTAMSHVNRPGTDPRQIKPNLNPRVATFLTKAIERDPAARFQTAAEFRDALKAVADK
jgi:serine/threonine protein kinase